MKQGSTLILKGAILLIGLTVLALCIYLVPGVYKEENAEYRPLVLGMYVAAMPFFIALFQTLKLLYYIDKNKAFSELSVMALKIIKYCAVAISVVYVPLLPYLHQLALEEDAPGVLAIGIIIIGASAVIATSAGVLQKLVQNAIDIKSENDLTV